MFIEFRIPGYAESPEHWGLLNDKTVLCEKSPKDQLSPVSPREEQLLQGSSLLWMGVD